MLNLARLERIRLHRRPWLQRLIAHMALRPIYAFAPGVRIHLEGEGVLPQGPVVLAMNHTDRYNYWPLQYVLYRRLDRFTATWVKGKYYERPASALFMEHTNNIPAVARGYIIMRDYLSVMGSRPSPSTYEALRRTVEAQATGATASGPPSDVPAAVTTQSRDMLGRWFHAERESYAEAVCALHQRMARTFVALNERAVALGLDVLIFPQGTRSRRLSRGHIGIAQMASHLRVPIVPVGCSGSDVVYPGDSPLARRGTITYRFGSPLTTLDYRRHGVPDHLEPFTHEAEHTHRPALQRVVDEVMERINALVDEPYRFSATRESQGVHGSERFL